MNKLSHEQVARMSPENRERYEKDLKRVKRNRRIVAGVVALILAAVAALALSMTVFFTVSDVKVSNKSGFYSEEEIINASGLKSGDNMMKNKPEDAAKRIMTKLPYILRAEVKRSFSGSVTITVKDDKASIIFPVKGGQALADYEGKVLELVADAPENSNFIVLKTGSQLSGNPGEKIEFADEKQKEAFDVVVKALKSCGLYDSISSIDISELTNIRIEYQHRMRIKVGDISEMSAKLSSAAEAIKIENESNPNTIAEVNATIPKKVYVNPVETLDEEVLAAAQAAIEEEERIEEEKEKKKAEEEAADEESEEDKEDENSDEDSKEEETEEDSENRETTDEESDEDSGGNEEESEEEGENESENDENSEDEE